MEEAVLILCIKFLKDFYTGLPFVRPFALNLLTHNNPPLKGSFYGTALSDGRHLSIMCA